MKYLIIGLGHYGGILAEELTALGHEVVGVDKDESHVDRVKDKMVTSFVLDATDEMALTVLPVRNVDLVIVAIGDNFGASVRIVSLLKKNKAKHIYARAVDDVHKAVLDAFSIDRILTPEQDAARMLAKLVGYHANDLNLEQEFGLKVISLVRGNRTCNCLGISVLEHGVANEFAEDYELTGDDELVCYGPYSRFIEFWKSVR